MFKSGQTNPFDELVAKATDENLTGEDWDVIITLCDKVTDEGETGARNVVASLLKRLTHRTPNVQLYSLSLAESLSKNCGVQLHRELASRAFTQALEKLITDRMTHEKVRRRALTLIAMWTSEFENDSSLGIMEECYNNLKAKNYKFEAPDEPPPPAVDDEVRRREEEELQRVLEMSMQDKGGRGSQYTSYDSSGAGSSSIPGPSASNATGGSSSGYAPAAISSSAAGGSTYAGGYSPAAPAAVRSPSPKAQPTYASSAQTQAAVSTASFSTVSPAPTMQQASAAAPSTTVVSRVRALYTFEATEPGELPFEKGDVIKVVDRGYKDWWRGQLKGRTGIFPVNYIEPMPEPTPAELAKEAEQEAAVFAQAANVDRLLTMLRGMDPASDNLADNEEVQELYRSCMSLRPKIVKLIDRYSQKRADLISMNESFVKARTIFDQMMEESLARHAAMSYDAQPDFRRRQSQFPPQARPLSQAPQDFYGYQGFGPSQQQPQPQPLYGAFPTRPGGGYLQAQPVPQQSPYGDSGAYGQRPGPAGYGQVQPGPYGAPTPTPGVVPPGPGGPYAPQVEPLPNSQGPYGQSPQRKQSYGQSAPQPQPQLGYGQPQSQVPQDQPQPQSLGQPQGQDPQSQSPSRQQQSGPPYVYDPNGTYPDPNVQAWAQYYAKGGKERAGAVYFFSVPGVTDGPMGSAGPQGMPDQAQHQGRQEGKDQAQGGTTPYGQPQPQQQDAQPNLYGLPQNQDQNQPQPYVQQQQQASQDNQPNPYGLPAPWPEDGQQQQSPQQNGQQPYDAQYPSQPQSGAPGSPTSPRPRPQAHSQNSLTSDARPLSMHAQGPGSGSFSSVALGEYDSPPALGASPYGASPPVHHQSAGSASSLPIVPGSGNAPVSTSPASSVQAQPPWVQQQRVHPEQVPSPAASMHSLHRRPTAGSVSTVGPQPYGPVQGAYAPRTVGSPAPSMQPGPYGGGAAMGGFQGSLPGPQQPQSQDAPSEEANAPQQVTYNSAAAYGLPLQGAPQAYEQGQAPQQPYGTDAMQHRFSSMTLNANAPGQEGHSGYGAPGQHSQPA